MINKILKILAYALFALAFMWVMTKLFFPDYHEVYSDKLVSYFEERTEVPETVQKIDNFKILLPENPSVFDPTLTDNITRQTLVNIFEPLVKPNRDLQMEPALAYTWGLIDDLTWEFRLRPNVKFHDGSDFTSEDVIASFERAVNHQDSELVDILEIITDIKVLDDFTIQIVTSNPDPLLLQRLSQLFIHPSEMISFETPIGSGPYKFLGEKDGKIILEGYVDYWAGERAFSSVEILTLSNPLDRIDNLVEKKVDFLGFVPHDAVAYFNELDLNLKSVPSLEVQFLVFNMDSSLFSDLEARKMFSYALEQEDLIEDLGGFVKPVNQFVSNGVFGYSPLIQGFEYDRDEARDLAQKYGFDRHIVKLHLLEGLDVLGDFVKEQLRLIGITVEVEYLDIDDLEQSIANGAADLYFLVYRADSGDAFEFFENVVQKEGESNIGGYQNDELENLLEEIRHEMDSEKRLFQLYDAMKIVVEDDVFGIPLFENETYFAFWDPLKMQPRLDGLIYFNEIKQD